MENLQGKLYEAKLKFNMDESTLTEYLKAEFSEDAIIEREGNIVTIAFYIEEDEDTTFNEELVNCIGDALGGGEYGECLDSYEINIEDLVE